MPQRSSRVFPNIHPANPTAKNIPTNCATMNARIPPERCLQTYPRMPDQWLPQDSRRKQKGVRVVRVSVGSMLLKKDFEGGL
jgi:hypothetical protein